MGVNFIKKIKFWLFQKIENFADVKSLKLKKVTICVENFESKILSEFKFNRYIDR